MSAKNNPFFVRRGSGLFDNYEAALVDKTNFDLATAGMFDQVKVYHKLSVRTDATISLILNGQDAITIASGDSPFETPDGMLINSILITNTGTANLKILGI